LVKHFQDDPDPPPFIKALAEVRQLATREGWCFQHVQAVAVAIDQYAAKAFGNRNTFSTSRTASVTKGTATFLKSATATERLGQSAGDQIRVP
jgi:hypothetical protein